MKCANAVNYVHRGNLWRMRFTGCLPSTVMSSGRNPQLLRFRFCRQSLPASRIRGNPAS